MGFPDVRSVVDRDPKFTSVVFRAFVKGMGNTLLLLISLRGLLFSFSILKKIETRDIYNGPHPNRASRDGVTNLWDL